MAAKSTDMQLFCKLIQWQRDLLFNNPAEIEFSDSVSEGMDVERWVSYFSSLATPQQLPEFDDDHKLSLTLQRLLVESLPVETQLPEIEESEVKKIVESLKNNNAAEIFRITSEHLKLASTSINIAAMLLIESTLHAKD